MVFSESGKDELCKSGNVELCVFCRSGKDELSLVSFSMESRKDEVLLARIHVPNLGGERWFYWPARLKERDGETWYSLDWLLFFAPGG